MLSQRSETTSCRSAACWGTFYLTMTCLLELGALTTINASKDASDGGKIALLTLGWAEAAVGFFSLGASIWNYAKICHPTLSIGLFCGSKKENASAQERKQPDAKSERPAP